MTTMTATEVKNRFGELADQVQAGPITITKSGRPSMVLISAEEFDRLTALDDRYWGEQALEAIRTQKPLSPEATSKWLESLVEGDR